MFASVTFCWPEINSTNPPSFSAIPPNVMDNLVLCFARGTTYNEDRERLPTWNATHNWGSNARKRISRGAIKNLFPNSGAAVKLSLKTKLRSLVDYSIDMSLSRWHDIGAQSGDLVDVVMCDVVMRWWGVCCVLQTVGWCVLSADFPSDYVQTYFCTDVLQTSILRWITVQFYVLSTVDTVEKVPRRRMRKFKSEDSNTSSKIMFSEVVAGSSGALRSC